MKKILFISTVLFIATILLSTQILACDKYIVEETLVVGPHGSGGGSDVDGESETHGGSSEQELYLQSIDPSIEGIISYGDDFLKEGDEDFLIPEQNVQKISETIYNILFTIGIIAAFIAGGILAIRFITGGLDEKADVKQLLMPYIIGLVVLFGAFTIWKIVLEILQI